MRALIPDSACIQFILEDGEGFLRRLARDDSNETDKVLVDAGLGGGVLLE
jgi:hypothetical protein